MLSVRLALRLYGKKVVTFGCVIPTAASLPFPCIVAKTSAADCYAKYSGMPI
jgi:hypothetical protein